jgi:hypothetical protein
MNEIKFYKLFGGYYKIDGARAEHVRAYKHNYGILNTESKLYDHSDMEPITEAQFTRVKKLILTKICGHV